MATTVSDRRETVSLIGNDKVEGTAVYGADNKKIGSVQRVMIDKISGKVAYAVVSFGGFWAWERTTTHCPGPIGRIDRIRRVDQQQGVAVRRRTHHRLGGNIGRRARAVLHQD